MLLAAGLLAAGAAGAAWWSSRRGAAVNTPAVSDTSPTPRQWRGEELPELPPTKSAEQAKQPAPRPNPFGKLITTGGLAGGGGIGAAGLAAGAAGAAAWVAGNAALGAIITGDAAGVAGAFLVGGGFSPVSVGNVGNVGRVLARDVDRALNGFGFQSGTGAGASAAYQVAGYLAGVTLALGGLTLIPFVGQVVGLVLLVGQLVNDADRVARGQERYRNELGQGARAVYTATHAAMMKAVTNDPANMGKIVTDEALEQMKAHAQAVARGWAEENNDSRRRAHMARPRGGTPQQHAEWGEARGVFLSDVSWVAGVIAADVGNDLTGLLSQAERAASERSGRLLSNAQTVMRCLAEPMGPLQSLGAHVRYFRAAEFFRGDVADNGDVTLDGARLDAATSKARGVPVVTVTPLASATGVLPTPPPGAPPAPGNFGNTTLSGAPSPPGFGAKASAFAPPQQQVVGVVKLGAAKAAGLKGGFR